MKTIKIIDLLNKIAKGEKVRCKYLNVEYREYAIQHFLESYIDANFNQIEDDYSWLNNEVEIIEEEKKIFPIDFSKEVIKKIEVPVAGYNVDYQLGLTLVEIFEKLNELIDVVNELKKESK